MTTKHLRFIVELKVNIHESPKGVGSKEEFERIQRLGQIITTNDETLLDVYKITFFDLLFGDYYTDEINRRIKPKTEAEFILPAANKMDPQDSAFFTESFSEFPKEDSNVDRDNVLNLFYSQFGRPKIVKVRFECLDSHKGKQSSSL
jgi:hypothetical protein